MYIFDFFKRLFHKNNIALIIYLLLNFCLIVGIFHLLIGAGMAFPIWKSSVLSFILYMISLVLALSPFGEWTVRFQTGCKKIKNQQLREQLEPIFLETYNKARKLDPSIPDDVQLFMSQDDVPNAFATGRRTVCITRGLLNSSPEMIKATLGHEFGHLAHKDTDMLLVVTVGNMFVTGFIMLVRICIFLFDITIGFCSLFTDSESGRMARFLFRGYTWILNFTVGALMWIWTSIGNMLVMKSSREKEYSADEFSFKLGYGTELCELLESFGDDRPHGLFAALQSSHPDNQKRIDKLVEKGAHYNNRRASYDDDF